MKLDEVVPLFLTDGGAVGLGLARSQDIDGAAATKDAARTERKKDVNMSLELTEGVGRGVG